MQDLYLPILLELTKEIGRLNQMISAEPPESVRAKQIRENDIRVMTGHKATFDLLGLSMCRLHVERIITSCVSVRCSRRSVLKFCLPWQQGVDFVDWVPVGDFD